MSRSIKMVDSIPACASGTESRKHRTGELLQKSRHGQALVCQLTEPGNVCGKELHLYMICLLSILVSVSGSRDKERRDKCHERELSSTEQHV